MEQSDFLNPLLPKRLSVLDKHPSDTTTIRRPQDCLAFFSVHSERDTRPKLECKRAMLADNIVEHQRRLGVLYLNAEDVVERNRPNRWFGERRKVLEKRYV